MKPGATSLASSSCCWRYTRQKRRPTKHARWLERMSVALATGNYEGLFTHSNGTQTESMRIVHRIDKKGRSQERLVSLDGSGREIVRTPEEVHAYLPDRKVVLVEPRNDKGSLLKSCQPRSPTRCAV